MKQAGCVPARGGGGHPGRALALQGRWVGGVQPEIDVERLPDAPVGRRAVQGPGRWCG